MENRKIYRFGPFSLDASAKVLMRDGEPVRLTRKAVETLLALVENAGRVQTKEQLLAKVWPDRVVDEANLTQHIAVLRRAMRAEEHSPAHIETFPGRGYRLVGPVEVVEESPAVDNPITGRRQRWIWRALAAGLFLAAIVTAVWWIRSAKPTRPAEFHRVALTRLAGKEYQPALAPDGARVAFLWLQDGAESSGVWVLSSGETSPHMVSRGAGDFSSPAWSPDGKSLAFIRLGASTGELFTASLESGEQRVITHLFPTRYGLLNRHLDWSPDGRWFAVDDTESGSEPLAIFLVDVATGHKRRLTKPDPFLVGDTDPRFSPDGRWISFIRVYHRAYQELFLISPDGARVRQLTTDGKQISGSDWMPDGRTIIFGSDRDGDFRLWRITVDAPQPSRTVQPTPVYGDFPIQLSLARRAPILAYSVLHQDFNIWRVALAPKPGEARWTRVVASAGQDASPQYSPDGSKICFRSDRSGEEQLWVADADGSNAAPITTGKLRPSVGRWSPDGKSIAFNNARTGELYLAHVSSGEKWSVRATGVTGIHPVFSADGKFIYAGTMKSVIRYSLESGAVTEILPFPGLSFGLAPDGRSLYFVKEPAGTSLWRLALGTGAVTLAVDGLVPYCTSCWAAASNGIYYLGAKPHSWSRQAIFYHDLATGRTHSVLEYPEPLLPIGSGPFSLSPDGRYLLCVRVDPSNADIMKVEPFP